MTLSREQAAREIGEKNGWEWAEEENEFQWIGARGDHAVYFKGSFLSPELLAKALITEHIALREAQTALAAARLAWSVAVASEDGALLACRGAQAEITRLRERLTTIGSNAYGVHEGTREDWIDRAHAAEHKVERLREELDALRTKEEK